MEKTTKTTIKEPEIKLNKTVWELPFNADLVAQVLYVYMSNERKGTAKAKTRGDVSGGGKKPWKQKGTGRARVGSIRSPLWPGGGVTFVPNYRNWERKINKQMTKKATSIMLSQRLREKALDFVNIEGKELGNIRKNVLKSLDSKVLIISDNDDVVKALRNTKGIEIVHSQKVNAKHITSVKKILVDKEVVKMLEERLANEK